MARPLLYKTKCEISGEDAAWKILTRSNSKWPPIGHYSLSHGRYLVNRARWLNHYYRMKCEISAEDASLKILTICDPFTESILSLIEYIRVLLLKQNLRFRGRMHPNLIYIEFKMTVNQLLVNSIGLPRIYPFLSRIYPLFHYIYATLNICIMRIYPSLP